jgi:hypothetical protein
MLSKWINIDYIINKSIIHLMGQFIGKRPIREKKKELGAWALALASQG